MTNYKGLLVKSLVIALGFTGFFLTTAYTNLAAQEIGETSITLSGSVIGQELKLTTNDGWIYTHGFWNDRGGVESDFISFNNSEHVYLLFHAPGFEELVVGKTYSKTTSYNYPSPFNPLPQPPALEIYTNYGSCTFDGEFTVIQLEYNPDGSVKRFAADFNALCDGIAPPPLPGTPVLAPNVSGSIRFNYLEAADKETCICPPLK